MYILEYVQFASCVNVLQLYKFVSSQYKSWDPYLLVI